MAERSVQGDGFASYVALVRAGSQDSYAAYRVYERHWSVEGKDARAVLRRAAIVLIENDPWFLSTSHQFLSALETRDLERLTPFVGAGVAKGAAAFLRAVLWFHARRGPYHPDRAGRVQLRRALAWLGKVPRTQRTRAWNEMVVGCYRVLDFDKYKKAFAKLNEITQPDWRAHGLVDFLEVVAAHKDWATFDRSRRRWDQLPVNHHGCECHLNTVHTLDGLRAAADRDWDAIPAALQRAAAVRGCPHLNTGGLRLDLAELLVARRKHLPAVRAYLDRALQFGPGKRLTALRRKAAAA